uniref:Uncharacterized protein n=1 Tax=Palpitomonas bilix TaxID=652834 RepID=A0A7S3D3I8_9EUKA|mmetsp:Transcript_2045/g.4225  ORF Transcript_2045/g.4225 Transcript_2045/m.4225 type:complete len:105 (+) Transcript_2045:99-413(+)
MSVLSYLPSAFVVPAWSGEEKVAGREKDTPDFEQMVVAAEKETREEKQAVCDWKKKEPYPGHDLQQTVPWRNGSPAGSDEDDHDSVFSAVSILSESDSEGIESD